jgi:hypothetical protein
MIRFAAVIGVLALAGCKPDGCSDEIGAYVMMQTAVSKTLKSPSTADFPSRRADGVIILNETPCNFQIASYVDAQNSFGGTVRTRFVAEMRYDPDDDTWQMTSLITD